MLNHQSIPSMRFKQILEENQKKDKTRRKFLFPNLITGPNQRFTIRGCIPLSTEIPKTITFSKKIKQVRVLDFFKARRGIIQNNRNTDSFDSENIKDEYCRLSRNIFGAKKSSQTFAEKLFAKELKNPKINVNLSNFNEFHYKLESKKKVRLEKPEISLVPSVNITLINESDSQQVQINGSTPSHGQDCIPVLTSLGNLKNRIRPELKLSMKSGANKSNSVRFEKIKKGKMENKELHRIKTLRPNSSGYSHKKSTMFDTSFCGLQLTHNCKSYKSKWMIKIEELLESDATINVVPGYYKSKSITREIEADLSSEMTFYLVIKKDLKKFEFEFLN